MPGLLDSPQNMSMLLSGLGLLTSKYQTQADKWKEFGAQGLLSGAEQRRAEAAKQAEIERLKPMNDLEMKYKQAQINALQNPTIKAPRWTSFSQGAGNGMMQRGVFNSQDPTQVQMFGEPYKPTAGVTINNAGAKGQEALSRGDAQKVIEADTYANKVAAMKPLFGAIRNDMSIFPTGKMASTELGFRQLGQIVGMGDDKEIAAGERLDKNMSKLVSQNMEFLKGAMSDGERDFTKKFSLGMGTSVEGNLQYMDFLEKVYERAQNKAPLMRQWFREHNSSLDGFDAFWMKYIDDNPIDMGGDNRPKGHTFNPATGEFE